MAALEGLTGKGGTTLVGTTEGAGTPVVPIRVDAEAVDGLRVRIGLVVAEMAVDGLMVRIGLVAEVIGVEL